MKYLTQFVAAAFLMLLVPAALHGDIVLTTGTNDAMDLDFDGAGTQTNGDLGFVTRTFVLTGGDLPGDPEFSDITSITIQFGSIAGNLSANNAAGTVSGGIGVSSAGEGPSAASLLSVDTAERLTVNVSSTSTDPLQQVLLSELRFSSWRNAFPVSQAEFDTATVAGNPFVFGSNPSIFDSPVSSVSISSVSSHTGGGGDAFRLHHIGLTVSSVPEPATFLLTGLGLFGMLTLRRRRPQQ